MARRKKVPVNDNNIAIAYYRCSSAAQDTSIEQQKEAVRKYADAHGYILTEDNEYPDDGISGTTDNRPHYRQMLSDIKWKKPHVLILWKSDRLGRDKYDLAFARKIIRDAGCLIEYVAEPSSDGSPEASLMEGIIDSMSAYYSDNLSVNVSRGQKFNADRGLYLGKKIFGYTTTGEGRHNIRYVIDPKTGPVVKRIYKMYIDGKKSMAQIAEIVNAEGWRSVNGREFDTNKIRRILKNDEYLGIYKNKGVVIDDGTALPALITKETFDAAQQMLVHNKKYGAQNIKGIKDEYGTPRFWLTGKLFCGECSTPEHDEPMQGTSGTSKTGAKHYYYSCNDQHKGKRGKGCKKKPVKKDLIEDLVCFHLTTYLQNTENLASLAVDIAEYYKKEYDDHGYLEGLKKELQDTERALNNVIKAIMAGAFGETVNNELAKLEERKKNLSDAVATEEIKQRVTKDKLEIQGYLEKFKNADMKNPENRELVLNYFVDKIYLYDDRIVITGKYDDDGFGGSAEYMLSEKRDGKSKRVRPLSTVPHEREGRCIEFLNFPEILHFSFFMLKLLWGGQG